MPNRASLAVVPTAGSNLLDSCNADIDTVGRLRPVERLIGVLLPHLRSARLLLLCVPHAARVPPYPSHLVQVVLQ
jgi:hypothetical protein